MYKSGQLGSGFRHPTHVAITAVVATNVPLDMDRINPLTLPKGVVLKCELTGEQATVKAELDGVVYYYRSPEHRDLDFESIREKIAPIEALIRNPPNVGTTEDRIIQQQQIEDAKHSLVDVTTSTARAYLAAGNYEFAVPPALHALRYSIAVFGDGSSKLVPAYLLLAEANLGLDRASKTEEFLSTAQWILLQHADEVGNELRARFHHNFGKLYRAQMKLEDSLREIATAVYFYSLEFSPDHILTAGCYFDLGDVFLLQSRMEPALGLFDKVVDIWYKYLLARRNECSELHESESKLGDDTADEELAEFAGGAVQGELGRDQALRNEVTSQITTIAAKRKVIMGADHIATGEAQYTLGLLYMYLGDFRTAVGYVRDADVVYREKLPEAHPSNADLRRVQKWLEAALLRQ